MKPENDATVIPFENEQLEYKLTITRDDLPRQLVALANANGGKLNIGITNDRKKVGVKGITSEDITNTARTGCVPPIIPKISQEVDDKGIEVILVEVAKGNHPPYRTNRGRYVIRVGPTVRDLSLEELIDLIVRGPHRGTILLRAKLDDLKNTITASLLANTEAGTEQAILGINELVELIRQAKDESAKLDAIQVLDKIAEHAKGFNDKVIKEIIFSLPKISTIYLIPNLRVYVPSEKLFVLLVDIVENVFVTLTLVAEKNDLVVDVLNGLYKLALGCMWAGYNEQTKRICEIIDNQNGRDRKLSKCCKKAIAKIKEAEQETDIYEPRRAAMLVVEKIDC